MKMSSLYFWDEFSLIIFEDSFDKHKFTVSVHVLAATLWERPQFFLHFYTHKIQKFILLGIKLDLFQFQPPPLSVTTQIISTRSEDFLQVVVANC